MASKALTCSASPLVSNRASKAPSAATGFGPNRLSMLRPSSKTRRVSLVVRAADEPQVGTGTGTGTGAGTGSGMDPSLERNQQQQEQPMAPTNDISPTKHKFFNKPALLGSFRYVREPWQTFDDEEKVVIKVDLPELSPNDINVRVEGKTLYIIDTTKKTLNHDVTFLLPDECIGTKDPKARLDKKGVLTVTLDKVTTHDTIKPILVRVEHIDDI